MKSFLFALFLILPSALFAQGDKIFQTLNLETLKCDYGISYWEDGDSTYYIHSTFKNTLPHDQFNKEGSVTVVFRHQLDTVIKHIEKAIPLIATNKSSTLKGERCTFVVAGDKLKIQTTSMNRKQETAITKNEAIAWVAWLKTIPLPAKP